MGQITISTLLGWILAGATALVALAKAWAIIKPRLHPENDLRTTVAKHGELLDRDNARLKRLEEQTQKAENFQGVMCRVLLAQLNHELSGNDVILLKSARDELNDYLTKR